ncbi:MAG: J domain-containing protein [Microbacteriaceae bacterium]|nr:J domain-containing protein [Microbacteriaceae bacterium]
MASQDWLEKDFYKILGVTKDVPEAELKKVYRKLARKYHPDSNQGDAAAEAKFKEISEAYSVLSDKDQRKEYDQFRAMGGGARFTAPGGSGQSSQGFEDVFANLFGGRAGFGGFGGPTPGQDMSATTSIAFIDSVNGTTIKLEYSGMAAINAKIPAGVLDGQKIKLRGKGQASPNGGPNGDLIITVTVKPHAVFSRDGNNLRLSVPVTFAEAVLGATITVPTLGGDPVKLKVAPNTPNGRVLRVKGKGVTTAKGTGDLLATVEVLVPAHISEKAAKALKEFEEALPDEDPRQDLLNRAGLL